MIDDSVIISLDAFDLQWIAMYAERIHSVKIHTKAHSKKHDVTKGEFELTYLGAMGEYATAKYFGVDMDMGLHAGGDNGTDLVIGGYPVHIKTTCRTGIPLFILDNIGCFTTQVGLLAQIMSPVRVQLCGVVSRKTFIDIHHERDFGYGVRMVCNSSEMQHVDILKENK